MQTATDIHGRHPWDVTPQEAILIQDHLRREVLADDWIGPVHSVAGIDVAYDNTRQLACAAVAVLSFPELQMITHAVANRAITFPYVPGLLSFREAPAVLMAMEKLSTLPDLLLCDGHGLAHPRRFGLACHLGVLCGLPSIGVAKRRLVGDCETVPDVRGAWQPVRHEGEIVGAALRTRPGANPIWVSTGHRVRLETALDFVLRCSPRFRLPEPLRRAHRLASIR